MKLNGGKSELKRLRAGGKVGKKKERKRNKSVNGAKVDKGENGKWSKRGDKREIEIKWK